MIQRRSNPVSIIFGTEIRNVVGEDISPQSRKPCLLCPSLVIVLLAVHYGTGSLKALWP